MIELVTNIVAVAGVAITSVIAASAIISEKRKERDRVAVPVRARSTRR